MVLWLLNKENLKNIVPTTKTFFSNNSGWAQLRRGSPFSQITIPDIWKKLQSGNEIKKELGEFYINNPFFVYHDDEFNKSCGFSRYNESDDSQRKTAFIEYYNKKWLALVEEFSYNHLINDNGAHRDIKILSEVPLKGRNGFIIGYFDIVIEYQIPTHRTENFIFWEGNVVKSDLDEDISSDYIEVKPEIKSFGETLRQLNTYRSYIPESSHVYLFTKDTRFKDAFEGQGINVLIMPEEDNKGV